MNIHAETSAGYVIQTVIEGQARAGALEGVNLAEQLSNYEGAQVRITITRIGYGGCSAEKPLPHLAEE